MLKLGTSVLFENIYNSQKEMKMMRNLLRLIVVSKITIPKQMSKCFLV